MLMTFFHKVWGLIFATPLAVTITLIIIMKLATMYDSSIKSWSPGDTFLYVGKSLFYQSSVDLEYLPARCLLVIWYFFCLIIMGNF